MTKNTNLIQPFIDLTLSGCSYESRFITVPSNMLIYEYKHSSVSGSTFYANKPFKNQFHFIASPYCQWIIGYNINNTNSKFYCIAASDKAFDITLDDYDYYFCIRFDDDIYYLNKNIRANAVPADMFSDILCYTPTVDSYEYNLCRQLSQTDSFENKINFFIHYLSLSKNKLIIPENVQNIRDSIKAANGSVTVSELAAKYGYSERHINRIFNSVFGFGPKTYCKFIRFQYALSEIISNPERHNSEFIYNIGYSDQAHFQREFKYFMGITPKQFTHLFN